MTRVNEIYRKNAERQNKKIWDKMVQTGIDMTDFRCSEYEPKVYKYIDDEYSGTEVRYTIDDYTGLLMVQYLNDSPEQCGGFICRYVYVGKEEYNVSHIADRCAFLLYDDRVYNVELDFGFAGYALTYIEATKSDSKVPGDMYKVELSKEDFEKLKESGYKEFRDEIMRLLKDNVNDWRKNVMRSMFDIIKDSIEVYPGMKVTKPDTGEYELNIDFGPEQDHKYCESNAIIAYTVMGRVLATKLSQEKLNVLIENDFEKDNFYVPFSSFEKPVEEKDLEQYNKVFN